jgi:hypothetical protein
VFDPGAGRIRDAQQTRADWHNVQSGFLLERAEIMRRAPDDQTRLKLLGRLRNDLEAR